MAEPELNRLAELAWAALLDHVGRERACPGVQLAEAIGLDDTRMLRLVVHHARATKKRPILSFPGQGYFRPATMDEVDHCYRTLRAQAIDTLTAAATLRKLGSGELARDEWIDDLLVREDAGFQRRLFESTAV